MYFNFIVQRLRELGLTGLSSKNLELFKQECFLNEFINCGKQQELLKNIPVYVVTDYNVSLYGAAEYMRAEKLCEL